MSDSPLVIRAATLEDASAISALLLSLARYCTIDPLGAGAEKFLASFQPGAVAALIANPAYRYLTGWVDGELGGVVAMRDHAHLYHLFVAERFHGRGYASRLWDAIRIDAEAAGHPGRYTVNSSMAAVDVYQHFGFVIHGEHMAANGILYVPMVLDAARCRPA
ncbi:MAG: GNAT family N-acetyltransferase [Gammaproteobacteria bacterium]